MKRLFNLFLLAAILAASFTVVSVPASTVYAAENAGRSSRPLFSPMLTMNTWNALGSGLNGIAYAITVSGGNVYAGGTFTDAGGYVNADYIAKWNGTSWSALGTGLNGLVYTIVVNGTDLYVGGAFTDAGGDPNADYIAKWNGTSWSALGNGLNGLVQVIAIGASNVYVGGQFTDAGGDANADYMVKLDGGTWESLGTTPLDSTVYSAFVAGADVYVGGSFEDAGGDANADYIARWDGTSWSALGGGLNGKVSVITMSDGEVYAGGEFTNAGGDPNADYILKWNGTSWSALGSGLNYVVRSVVGNGQDIYAGGYFTNAGGNANADYIAKWDGTGWSALGSAPLDSSVNRITIDGVDLYAGGQFADAGGDANADHIARFEIDPSPPTVNSFSAASSSTSLNIPIPTFTASDNTTVTGYKITESSTPPSATAAGWAGSAPTTYMVASSGSYTLYPWAKDVAGNVSAVYGSPISVNVDASAPMVTAFTVPAASSSLAIPITTFTSSDNIGVTGYVITASSTSPSAGAGGWTGTPPTSYTVASSGSYTLYPWVKDALGNVSAVYGSPLSVNVDASAPGVTVFSVPATSTSLNISITTFTASDNIGVAAYLVTESQSSPSTDDPNWMGSAPTAYTVGSSGSYTLYPWVKDAAGNISPVYSSPGGVTVDDTKPTVNSFTAVPLSASLNISITAFAASDNAAVTGYKITTSATPPSAAAAGWTGSAPTTYIVASSGSYMLYPWAKDALGNVSAVYGSPASVTVDAAKPTATAFTAPATSTSLNIPITTFTASDNAAVTGYKITTSATPPSAGAAGWTGSAPTTYTVGGSGSYTLYPWVKDAAGNVAEAYGSPVSVTVDTAAPAVDAFTASSSSNSLDIPISTFTASDNVMVTGYLITESGTPPSAGAADWTSSAPTIYTVAGEGSYTLYPWAKDAVGSVSAIYGSPVSVRVDTTSPTVTLFTLPASSNSFDIPVTSFTASDDVDVTGYLITESSTPPLADADGWSALGPGTYPVVTDGSFTLYPWVKDAAGNISPLFSGPVSVTVDATAPIIFSFARQDPAIGPTDADLLVFRATLSEAVSNVSADDFSVNGSTTASVTGVDAVSSTIYDVTVSGGDLDAFEGEVGLDLSGSANIQDGMGNLISFSEPASDETYLVDNTSLPITQTFVSSALPDGWLLESTEISNKGGKLNTTATTLNVGDDAANKQYRDILSFDTTTLPEGAVITKITLNLKKAGVVGGGNPINTFKGFMVEIRKGEFGTAALELADFKAPGHWALGPSKPVLVSGWYSLDLTAAYAWINTDGSTQIRLRFKLDDNNNFIANYLKLYSGNANPADQPQLIIEYSD